MTRNELLIAWIEGRYGLGWHSHLAMWILEPVINEMLVHENKLNT